METGEGQSNAEARRKRAEALRALAEDAPAQVELVEKAPTGRAPSGAPPSLRPVQRRRWPGWALPLASGVALLAVISVVVAHGLLAPAPKARVFPAKLALDPTVYGIACLEYAAWSPDSRRLAILGQQETCGSADSPLNYSYYPEVIAIVDPLTGRLLEQIHPDATVQRDLHLHAPQYITPVNGVSGSGDLTQQGARYNGLVWSPDSKRIAAPFAVDYADKPLESNNPLVRLYGMYVVNADGTNDHAAAITEGATWVDIEEWNMRTMQPVPFTPPKGSDTQDVSAHLYPASLSYSWRPDGTLAGATPLHTTSAPPATPLGPVGNPDGGASFTIWQPLQSGPYSGESQSPIYPAVFTAYAGNVLAWSPDGTYLLNAQMASLRLQPSRQPRPAPALVKMRNNPIAPVRDAAFDSVLNAMNANGAVLNGGDFFAWRLDGKRLAVTAQDNTGAVTVTILDCATGATLGSVNVVGNANTYGGAPGTVMWSPNGSQLLVDSNAELFLLGPGALPK